MRANKILYKRTNGVINWRKSCFVVFDARLIAQCYSEEETKMQN